MTEVATARLEISRCMASDHCSHCCAGPMAILLVMGVMDLRAMAVVAAAITVERLAPTGERVARATGAVVVGAGLLLIARAAGLG
jgi:predicted metal-binding membrane protein